MWVSSVVYIAFLILLSNVQLFAFYNIKINLATACKGNDSPKFSTQQIEG